MTKYKSIKSNYDMTPQEKQALHNQATALATQSIVQVTTTLAEKGHLSSTTIHDLAKDMAKGIEVLRKELSKEAPTSKILG